MPKPTPEQIREAGRQLQRGGILGRGSKKAADKLVEQAKKAGFDEQEIAFQILGAAAECEPRRWAR
ncbi:hypothetical protein [Streptomyces rishiriensis]|uniref:hypothetical protein n=1 Tax=Streptomyces rishiriensis TaxID=68264 RepID=UPI000D58F935|nr:hypothetical protein [Streptomyces rishiriensis]